MKHGMTAVKLIERLGLEPLPLEGGYFRETYRSEESLTAEALPERYGASRAFSTQIYYLLTPDTFSALHRVGSDEVFHFYLGDSVEMLQLCPDGSHSLVLIGSDIEAGQIPQVIVPHGIWQGCRLVQGGEFALMGTTVAPGFDYADYEHGDRDSLTARYPACADTIAQLTA